MSSFLSLCTKNSYATLNVDFEPPVGYVEPSARQPSVGTQGIKSLKHLVKPVEQDSSNNSGKESTVEVSFVGQGRRLNARPLPSVATTAGPSSAVASSGAVTAKAVSLPAGRLYIPSASETNTSSFTSSSTTSSTTSLGKKSEDVNSASVKASFSGSGRKLRE